VATHVRLSFNEGARTVERMFGLPLKEYLDWCYHTGLEASCTKTLLELQREHKKYCSSVAVRVLKNRRQEQKSDVEILKMLVQNKSVSIRTHHLANVIPTDSETRAAFVQIIEAADKNRTKMLGDNNCVRIIARLAVWHPYWVRSPSEWKSKSHSQHRQISSLIKHLFAKYKMPDFFDAVWEKDVQLHQEWYIHVGAGNNIRTARMLPLPLTKAMAHHFLRAPESYSVFEAFLYGQVMALKGSRRISDNLCGTNLLNMDDQFRQSVIRWLVDNPMHNTDQYGPFFDYVYDQKYRRVLGQHADGRVVHQPAQPNLSMNGRNPETLLAQVERWHRELRKSKRTTKETWEHTPYSGFFMEEGQPSTRAHKKWSIIELTRSRELFDEGRAMKHCVSSYSVSCATGKCSIWSLRLTDCTGSWRLVTIELRMDLLVQARGLLQRKPTQQEWHVIKLWAAKNNISIASYVR